MTWRGSMCTRVKSCTAKACHPKWQADRADNLHQTPQTAPDSPHEGSKDCLNAFMNCLNVLSIALNTSLLRMVYPLLHMNIGLPW